MTEIEIKSLKTQIELYKGIVDCDRMILHTVQSTASNVFEDIIRPKMYIKDGQETVELTIEEFKGIRNTLMKLSSNEGFAQMNSYIKSQYIEPKNEKQRILSMLK